MQSSIITDYKVIEAYDSKDLSKKVLKQLSLGYELVGGVSYSKYGNTVNYTQAMIQRKYLIQMKDLMGPEEVLAPGKKLRG